MSKFWIAFLMLLSLAHNPLVGEGLTAVCSLPPQVERVIDCFAEQQKKKGLELVTKNGDGPCGLEKILLMFDYFDPITVDSGRHLMLTVIDDLLEAINQNLEMKKYFVNFPLTVCDIDIRIRMRTRKCGFIYPVMGNVAYILFDQRLIYGTINSYTYLPEILRFEVYGLAKHLDSL